MRLPAALVQRVRELAQREHRSLAGQLAMMIEEKMADDRTVGGG